MAREPQMSQNWSDSCSQDDERPSRERRRSSVELLRVPSIERETVNDSDCRPSYYVQVFPYAV